MYRFKSLCPVNFKNDQSLYSGYGFHFLSRKWNVVRLHSPSETVCIQDAHGVAGALWLDVLLPPFTGPNVSFSASSILLPSFSKLSVTLVHCLFFPRLLSGQISRVPACYKGGKTFMFWPETVLNSTN